MHGHQNIKGMEVEFRSFLISLRYEGEWSISRPDIFLVGKNPGTGWMGDRLGPTAFRTIQRGEKLLGPAQIRTPDRPTLSLVTTPATIYLLQMRKLKIKT